MTLVTGLTYTVQGFLNLVAIKYVNVHLEETGQQDDFVGASDPYGARAFAHHEPARSPLTSRHFSGYTIAMGSFLITAPTALSFIILGFGLRTMEITVKKERLGLLHGESSHRAGECEIKSLRGPL